MTNPKDRIGAQKVPLGLIPPAALAHTAVAMYDGASKYGRWNWRGESVAASVYVDACLRHILDWYHGEEVADDSQAHHLGHAIACLAIILDAQGTDNLIDDRPAVNQNCSEIFAQLSEKIKRINGLREQAQGVTRDVQKAATGCCAPSIYTDDYYGLKDAVAIVKERREEQELALARAIIREKENAAEIAEIQRDEEGPQISWTECLLGHRVEFIDETHGYIDGKYLRGPAFTQQVLLYREGYNYIDDKLAAQYREANRCEQPVT